MASLQQVQVGAVAQDGICFQATSTQTLMAGMPTTQVAQICLTRLVSPMASVVKIRDRCTVKTAVALAVAMPKAIHCQRPPPWISPLT